MPNTRSTATAAPSLKVSAQLSALKEISDIVPLSTGADPIIEEFAMETVPMANG